MCWQGAEQSAGIETGLLEDGSIAATDGLSTNCVGSKAKQERKGFWQRSRRGSLSIQTSLLLPFPGVPPSDPSPCSDMP